jgi:putative transcriptional regulator
MTKAGKSILRGLKQAVDYMDGKRAGSRTHVVEVPDVKMIRKQLGMSQSEFAEAYRIPLDTLQGWEQARREPDATALAYLRTIARLPKQVRAALRG